MQKVCTNYLFCFFLLSVFFLNSKTSNAQQDPMYTQYMHNQLTVNPAYAGSSGMLSAMLLSRDQWVGFDGAPKTRTLSLHTPIPNYKLGTGITYINDVIGPVKQNSFYANIAYQLNLGVGTLAMGLKVGVDHMQIDLMGLKLDQAGDPNFQQGFQSDMMLNFGLGFYFYTPKFYAGLASPRLIENYVENDVTSSRAIGFKKRHYFFTTGLLINLNDYVKLKPSALAKIVFNAPVSFDVSANFIFYDKLWLGANYRIEDSFSLMFQYQINSQIRIGYAFDKTNSELSSYNNGSHEIMISSDFHFDRKRIMTPRYF